jgi:hypothetical protein
VDNSASIVYNAAMTTGCPLWWRVPTYSELRVFAAPTTLADYPQPDGFTMPTTGIYWSATTSGAATSNGGMKWSVSTTSLGFNMSTKVLAAANIAGISASTDAYDMTFGTLISSASSRLRCVRDI